MPSLVLPTHSININRGAVPEMQSQQVITHRFSRAQAAGTSNGDLVVIGWEAFDS